MACTIPSIKKSNIFKSVFHNCSYNLGSQIIQTYGDVYFVRFLRIQLYKITRKLLQNVFCRDSCTFFAMDKKFPWRSKLGSKLTVFWVHKDMSKSYREGIDQKLKTMAFPYKMKGWQKSDKLCIFIL